MSHSFVSINLIQQITITKLQNITIWNLSRNRPSSHKILRGNLKVKQTDEQISDISSVGDLAGDVHCVNVKAKYAERKNDLAVG